MQPKTHIQKEVNKLAKKLPKKTKAQASWASKNLFQHYVYQTKTRNVCLECGHEWTIFRGTCPKCHTELIRLDGRRRTDRDKAYFVIADVVDRFQVFRYFYAERNLKVGNPKDIFFVEVFQHWIEPNGKMTNRAISINGMSQWTFSEGWAFGSSLEIKGNSDRYYRYDAHICPKPKFIPNLIRNGFTGNFHKLDVSYFTSLVLSSTHAETLLKSGQIKMFHEFDERRIKQYWRSICICIRNKYRINDPSMWFDHLDLLERFGKDIHSPKYICPRSLKADHQRLTNKAMRIDDRERYERKKKEEYENKLFREAKKRLFDLEFTDGNIRVVVLRTPQQFKKEGELLKHCVYVNEYHKRDTSLIMSARKGKEWLETIELSLKDMKILQCRGYKNEETSYHKAIMDLVQKNTKAIKKRIKQVA